MTRSLRILIALLFLLFSTGAFSSPPVNINTANAKTLASTLKGVGSVKAQAIVDYREKHGLFSSVGSLHSVKGIGETIVAENRENMTTGGEKK